MAKRVTKRAKAQAQRAAQVKAVQQTGYTKRAATKFIEHLKDLEATTGQQMTAEDLQRRAAETKAGAVARSRMRKTSQGAAYAERMLEREKIMQDLRSRGILAGQFFDMAEAAVEGRYKEALRINQKAYDQATQKLQELIDENRQHLTKARGDERIELQSEISYLQHELEALQDQASLYGTGKPLNLKNTSAAKTLANLF